ncbi:uncharacterized protein LOC130904120 isoform X1 [Diorhabda carinulata]|uniref:uncharacterized protein LOC130904120 isoform X1 n=1 Tax=Diorhabda carinulata TaxID=1163345 RepID=UPI0025A14E3B|nr:uncharacterized protein LOC130904120 isoform X1 [Diorhabda carinulata]XP_057672672.1 uncharacterized protein LOC130904120 isoform X1 [Diorhabda carinulata]XP_057672673.1 uncharacterized protein LOC130904120 isoform X1 [Diorhabda carinulata]XP_057672675.1 uncharacterized protein LOC130904120 isoform X1 [Diorhabda carinulata]
MGCNTSKDTVPVENETKEHQEGESENIVEDKKEIKLSEEGSKDVVGNHVEESTNSKPASAKTITLKSNDSTNITPNTFRENSKESTFGDVGDGATSVENESQLTPTVAQQDSKDEERAATKIQAVFRGHQTRKSMKQPTGKVEPSKANTNSNEPTREELEAEFRLDDAELCNAATKIQASFRGHMTRKGKEEHQKSESSTSQVKTPNPEEELDIDLSDPDLNKAAVKIQASFRGHMTRKDDQKSTN